MSRRNQKRSALRLPLSTSPVARRAQASPVHAIPPRFLDEEDVGSTDDAVDANLEEDLLMEVRTLVKKEKYLDQLEEQLREYSDALEDSASDSSNNYREAGRRGLKYRYEGLYDDEGEEEPLPRARRTGSTTKTRRAESKMTEEQHTGHEPANLVTKGKAVVPQTTPKNVALAREHYRACFVELNPVEIREIRALVLASQDLHIRHLRTLSKNLFLFSALHSVDLSNNQLDDSGSKEIRDLMCCPGLQALDLSRNLLGRLTARTICERLRHQAKLRSLDLHGNLFFFDRGDAAGEVARLFAKAVAVNEFLLHFCLTVSDQVERSTPLSEQRVNANTSRRSSSHAQNKASKGKGPEITTAASEFTRHLAEQLRQGGKNSGLRSLALCYAEFSRRAVLNTVKMANRLMMLDLSFAFIGIPGAQMVAAALRIDGYATLTQLNMRCNRIKSMGARAILAALCVNERLTSLDLSHNEIRGDIVHAVVGLLSRNKVLTRLDLSQNALVEGETQGDVQCLRDAIMTHGALLSLGQLNSSGMNESQERMLQGALDSNRIADDHSILDSINDVAASRPIDAAVPPRKRHMLGAIVELSMDELASDSSKPTYTTVWQRKALKDGRLSLKWRMAVRTKQIGVKTSDEDGRDSYRHGSRKSSSPLVWMLVVSRRCEARGSIEDVAATARFHQDEEGASYTLYSAVAYCDSGDTVSLKLGVEHDEGGQQQCYKVFVKDIAFIPHHSKDRRHLLLSIPRSLTGSKVQWRMKTQRCMAVQPKGQEAGPSSFLWEGVIQRVYIHTTGSFRLLARVQFPASLAHTTEETKNALTTRFWWQLQRSSCWDPHTNHVEIEGTYFDLHAVLRNSREVVFFLPAMEWMAGEYLQLSVTTISEDVVVRVVQFQLFHEISNWERPSAVSNLNFT